MDPLSAGASVLPFAILGLQSIKAACGILSTYKDGREQVKRAQKDAESLDSLLKRLSQSRVITHNHDPVLAAKIAECTDDVKVLDAKLKRLTGNNTDRLVERHLKKIKIFFKADEMKKMSAILSRHTDILNLHLNTTQSETLFVVQDQLGVIDKQGQSLQRSIVQGFSQQTTTTTAIVQGTVTTDGQRTREQLATGFQQSTKEVLSAIQGLSSTDQSNQMMDMLKAIFDRVSGLPGSCEEHPQVSEVQDSLQPTEDTPAEEILPYAEVEAGIVSILAAIQNKQGVFLLREAEDIGASLDSLLKAMQSESFLATSTTYESTYSLWCETSAKEDVLQLRRSLKAAQGVALSSHSVSVNKYGKRTRHEGIFVNSRWNYRSYKFAAGNLSIISSKKYLARQRRDVQADDAPLLIESATEYETRIQYTPELAPSASSGKGIEAIIRRFVDGQGTLNSIPILMVKNVVPRGSHIFTLVEEGRLSEFKEMLYSGKASIRDQDEKGASLLHYAYKQPNMCRFLLDHGADVDHIGRSNLFYDGLQTTAIDIHIDDFEDDPDALKASLECRKMILEAGCDPTIPATTKYGQMFGGPAGSIFMSGHLDSMRVFLDHSFGFFSINSKLDDQGSTPLHLLCCKTSCSVEAISFLLDRGADIQARDNNGGTVLHSLMKTNNYTNTDWRRIRASLLCLLTRGADPRAVDNKGRSVSYYAYEANRYSIGDPWDSALTEAGYDIAEFRRGWPRKAKYNWLYTREYFEEMWRGREHLCPYYYDYEVEGILELFECKGTLASDDEAEADSESDEWSDSDDGGVGIL